MLSAVMNARTERVVREAGGPGSDMRGGVERAEQLFAGMFDWSDRSRLNTLRGGTVGTGACACDSHVVTVYPPPARRADLSVTCEEGRPFLSGHRCCDPPKGTAIPETMEKRGLDRTFSRDSRFIAVWMMKDLRGGHCRCRMFRLTHNPPFRLALQVMDSGCHWRCRTEPGMPSPEICLLHSALPALIEVYMKKIPLLFIVLRMNAW